MKLATTTADFKKYAASDAERVRMYAGTGFKHLDFNFYEKHKKGSDFLCSNWMDDVKAAGKAAEQLGFDFVQAHSPGYNSENPKEDHEAGMLATIRSIEACGYLGIPNIVVHTGVSKNMKYPVDKQAYFEASKRFLNTLAPYMEKHNVNVLIENGSYQWMGDMYFFLTPEDMLDFVKYFNHPLLHICWDTGHANSMGRDPYQDILKLGSELRALHVQDNFGTYDEHIAPFMGTLPLDSLMQGLIASNYKGYFTFESTNILVADGEWPFSRKVFPLPEKARLFKPTPALKQKSIAFLYEIGKTILEQYGCFED